jgi:diguanylate cyclase (GGDEF)-like protein/PAS domain S-box-containing protein
VPWLFVATCLVVVAVDRLLPGAWLPRLLLDAVGIAAAGALAVGIRAHRPACPSAWRLLFAGFALLVAGDLMWDIGALQLGVRGSANPVATLLYLSGYPCLLLAVLKLARARTPDAPGRTLIDGLAAAAAALVPCWQFLIAPALHGLHGSVLERTGVVAFPLVDLLLVGALASILCTTRFRGTALWLLLGGLAITLAADMIFLGQLHTGTVAGFSWLDQLWAFGYCLIGAAGLHPSMADVGQRAPAQGGDRARVALLGSALLVGPAVILGERVAGTPVPPIVAATSVMTVAAMVVWRLLVLVGSAETANARLREREERFRSLVQHSLDVILLLAPDGTILYVSPSVERILGAPDERYIGTNVGEHVHPDDALTIAPLLRAAAANSARSYLAAARVRHADGSWRTIEGRVTGHVDDPGVRGIVANLRDVTERTRVDALRTAETRVLEMLAQGAPRDDTLHAIIEAVEPLLPDAACSIRLRHEHRPGLGRAVAPSLPSEFVAEMDASPAVLVSDDDEQFLDTRIAEDLSAHRDGWNDLGAPDAMAYGLQAYWRTPILSSDRTRLLGLFSVYHRRPYHPNAEERALVERATHLAAIAFDRAEARSRLGYLALHDPLTDLPNRTLVLDRLDQALMRLDRRMSTAAVLVLDLDRFTVINDSLGHDVGDQLLDAVARRIVDNVRPGDTVGRLGGDEFVVVCEDIGDDREAETIAERIASAVSEPLQLARGDVVVTASIGIAVSHNASDRPEGLLRDADAALYRAKAKGGARHELFDETMHTRAVVRLLTERALRRAIDHDELCVWYQPQIHIASGETVAVEALVRWQHPVRGIVGPQEFIDVAEETGLIVPIGAKVLDQACAQTADWRRASVAGRRRTVSVNLSARQLARSDLPERIAGILRDHDTDPETVCLEITESVLLDDLDTMAEAVRALKDLGLRLAIDDFGTGYSSLAYLKRFPFDELKIDRSFVEGVGRDDTDDAIVAATIELAHALGLVVAAEGIETEAQLARLVEFGCDLAQGYLFARPQPVDALEDFAVVSRILRSA